MKYLVNDRNDIYINPINTISLPIRHSDKCKSNSHVGGEMECWTIDEYISFLESVSYLSDNRIDTVIITSESTEFVNNLTDKILKYDEWKYSNHKWKRVIINRDDISSQIGASDYMLNRERYEEWISYIDNRLGTKLEYDPIVGALSSLLLQISSSKYIVHTKSSNWLDLIWSLSKHLNCESIFWKKQLFVERLGISIDLDKQCFEFNQWGLANKLVFRKSITYPPNYGKE